MKEHFTPMQGHMNNFKTGENLLTEAELDLERVNTEYKGKHWNRVVRASQEAVERCLKGVLKMMGIEYPKVHDVGDVFEIACNQKEIDISEEVLQEIKEVSTKLSEERAPAFYMEKMYTKQEAQKAMQSAKKVIEEVRELSIRLTRNDGPVGSR